MTVIGVEHEIKAQIIKGLSVRYESVHSGEDGEVKFHVAVNMNSVTHLVGVVIIQRDRAELRGDAAAFGESGSSVPIRSLYKLVRNGNLLDRGRSCPDNDLREQSGVKHEPSKGQDETHDQKQDQR